VRDSQGGRERRREGEREGWFTLVFSGIPWCVLSLGVMGSCCYAKMRVGSKFIGLSELML